MKLILFFSIFVYLFFLQSPAWGEADCPNIFSSPRSTTPKRFYQHQATLNRLVCEVLDDIFPELQKMKIVIRPLKMGSTFFATLPAPVNLVKKRNKRYLFLFNPLVLNKKGLNTLDNGLKGIIAHELAHIVRYFHGSRKDFFDLRFIYRNIELRIEHEYKTEYLAIERSLKTKENDKFYYIRELIKFRNWLYSQLSEQELITKREVYPTPEELKHYIQQRRIRH